MHAKAQKWGNSLSVRIPKAVANKIGLHDQDPLEIEVDGNKVILLPKKGREYRLKDLLKGVTKRNLHRAVEFGHPVGREAL